MKSGIRPEKEKAIIGTVLAAMATASGEDPLQNTGSRKRKAVMCRYMAMDQMIDRGITAVRAAAVFGKNHSTAVHARKTVKEMLRNPAMYPETGVYTRFMEVLHDTADRALTEERLADAVFTTVGKSQKDTEDAQTYRLKQALNLSGGRLELPKDRTFRLLDGNSGARISGVSFDIDGKGRPSITYRFRACGKDFGTFSEFIQGSPLSKNAGLMQELLEEAVKAVCERN